MKRRILFPLVGFLMTLIYLAGPATAASSSCNCWEGDMICVISDGDGNPTGWIFVRDAC